ncbi:MAG: septum formation protein Maf [Proteobacteria bacterium]|jgi:septum formation protein|nr:septum formation protein Maf [Pseudomonadota bacterium]
MSEKTTTIDFRPLILASGSRYRKSLLERLGVPFDTVAPDLDETPVDGEAPAATARRLAIAKARAVAVARPGTLVIGSDQVADCDGVAVSKPGTHEAARAQLASLSGRRIVFHTAVALIDAASHRCQLREVDVTSRFRRLDPATIERYLVRERPYDCAGAVRSESLGIALFESIENADPTALIGLPLIAVTSMLANEGVDVLDSR